MKKETVNIILTIVALIPMTYFMVLSIYALANLLSKFDVDDTLILISITFGILGYVGLLMNLKQSKNKNVEFINLTFLSIGIIGFVLFNSIQGGTKAWKWVIMIEEPDEWLMFVGPILITMYLSIIKGKRLITKN
ncbi:hypothetical protein DCS32_11610 [Dokdonia sp. Dokd-P16]|uniref:hypothetical protein n=1 Tax=Dokdonia sp. Dokd-P16 TaxID=2173169 RepID=UPI000D54A30E|nr:hypothetical protein [Dokdonia sp. Dokd-P16]AWH74780.1 hypothetical protein DCS32_11610 [Dokdonia sp. Dokd-P16]